MGTTCFLVKSSWSHESPTETGHTHIIKRGQLGKGRINTEQFNKALYEQFRNESEQWHTLSDTEQQGTCTKIIFDLLKKHDLGIHPDWKADQWANALLVESPNGLYHLAFEAAKDRMIYHDSTRGFIGSLAKKAFARYTKPKSTVEPQVA